MAKEEKNSGAILYFEYKEHFDLLSREDKGDLVSAMMEYGMNGVVSTELSTCAKMAFSFIKKQMDRDAEKYKKKCEKNAINGKTGGRPKKTEDEKPNGYFENQTKPNDDFEKPKKPNKKEKENKKENKNINTLSNERVDAHAREDLPTKQAYGKFGNVLLTDEEYADVKAKCPAFIDVFSDKLFKKGYKFDNHYEIILQWAKEKGMVKESRCGGYDTDEFFQKAVERTKRRRAVC